MKRLTDAEFQEACDEEFPVALEQEAKRARESEAALLDTLKEIAAGRLDHEHGLDDFHDRARSLARDAIAKAEGK